MTRTLRGCPRAVVSSDAQHPGWFTLLGAAREIRTHTVKILGLAPPAGSWARAACERLTRFELAIFSVAGRCSKPS